MYGRPSPPSERAVQETLRRPPAQVVRAFGHAIRQRPIDGEGDAAPPGALGPAPIGPGLEEPHGVGQARAGEHRLDAVKARFVPGEDAQAQVDLRARFRRPDLHAGRHLSVGRHLSGRRHSEVSGGGASLRPSSRRLIPRRRMYKIPSTVMGRKVRMW